jgi:hypothetical protein
MDKSQTFAAYVNMRVRPLQWCCKVRQPRSSPRARCQQHPWWRGVRAHERGAAPLVVVFAVAGRRNVTAWGGTGADTGRWRGGANVTPLGLERGDERPVAGLLTSSQSAEGCRQGWREAVVPPA